MDFGGFQWGLVDIVAVLVLLGVFIWAVLRVRSKGRSTSPPKTERATHDLYKEEERRHDQGTDGN